MTTATIDKEMSQCWDPLIEDAQALLIDFVDSNNYCHINVE